MTALTAMAMYVVVWKPGLRIDDIGCACGFRVTVTAVELTVVPVASVTCSRKVQLPVAVDEEVAKS